MADPDDWLGDGAGLRQYNEIQTTPLLVIDGGANALQSLGIAIGESTTTITNVVEEEEFHVPFRR